MPTSCARSSVSTGGARSRPHTGSSRGTTPSPQASGRSQSCSGANGSPRLRCGVGAGTPNGFRGRLDVVAERRYADPPGKLRPLGTEMGEGTQTRQDLPPAQRHIIKRPRLTKLLDEAEARIILLVAPAGYGKTTLAREWLRFTRTPYAWYQARPSTIDPTVLARDIASEIH